MGLALTLALLLLVPTSASATTGSIEGVTVEPSLGHASVQNLSVNYDGCSAAGNPTCAWEASAWLVPPPRTSCPSNGSGVFMATEDPPGFPGLPRRKIWEKGSTGDETAQSGPLLFSLEGVNDQYLCLYATHQPVTATSSVSSGMRPAYTPEFPQADLLATQLLHVDQPAPAHNASSGEVEMGISGEIVPSKLPRSQPVPITLRVGFTSEEPNTHTAPELTRIAIDIFRNVTLQTAGLPSCPIADLYSSAATARQSCAGSLVGHGSVTSEVTLPGQATATIDGRLLAFYAFAEGRPRILAQVTSSGTLPLTYVIPFQIGKAHGAFGTSLVVRKMRRILGRCRGDHPNCFAQPYTLKGVYGHISKFELSLHRLFAHDGKKESFVSADCPAQGRQSVASSQFGVSLRYDLGSSLGGESATLLRRCKTRS